MDPDVLGITLVPDYDTSGQVIYRDADQPDMHAIRRVRTHWGVDPRVTKYDLVVQIPTMVSPMPGIAPPPPKPPTVQTIQWLPKREQYNFVDLSTGFRFENYTQSMCLIVTRDNEQRSQATLYRLGANKECREAIGNVVGMRIHELVLFAPGSEGWFARYGTSMTRSNTNG